MTGKAGYFRKCGSTSDNLQRKKMEPRSERIMSTCVHVAHRPGSTRESTPQFRQAQRRTDVRDSMSRMYPSRCLMFFLAAFVHGPAGAADLTVNLRSRVEAFKGSGDWRAVRPSNLARGKDGRPDLRHVGQTLVQRRHRSASAAWW